MTKTTKTYQELSDELDKVVALLEDPTTSIDDALRLYKESDKLINQLQDYLDNTRNEIKILTKQWADKEI
jgi:exodeoxyribonuclease VII small subunit